eukprot:5446379-Lingulodinium_polyedra.AAC.1
MRPVTSSRARKRALSSSGSWAPPPWQPPAGTEPPQSSARCVAPRGARPEHCDTLWRARQLRAGSLQGAPGGGGWARL